MMEHQPRRWAPGTDQGAVLILAMVFLLAIGLVAVATADMAVNAGANTVNTRAQAIAQANLESEASAAISATRNSYDYAGCTSGSVTPDPCYGSAGPPREFTSSASNCSPTEGAVSGLEVWCTGSGGWGNGTSTRTVRFYVCVSGTCNAGSTSAAQLFAEVIYRDLPEGEAQSNDLCSPSLSTTCGITVSIDAWDMRPADS